MCMSRMFKELIILQHLIIPSGLRDQIPGLGNKILKVTSLKNENKTKQNTNQKIWLSETFHIPPQPDHS